MAAAYALCRRGRLWTYYVSLALVASETVVALGLRVADPLIGLAIMVVALRIARDSWDTIHDGHR